MAVAFEIYQFDPGVDVAAAKTAAQRLIRLPHTNPEEIRVNGYVPPATSVTVNGVTYEAAEFLYEMSASRGIITRIRIGTSSPEATPFRGLNDTATGYTNDVVSITR